jgi:hypothetical protein
MLCLEEHKSFIIVLTFQHNDSLLAQLQYFTCIIATKKVVMIGAMLAMQNCMKLPQFYRNATAGTSQLQQWKT